MCLRTLDRWARILNIFCSADLNKDSFLDGPEHVTRRPRPDYHLQTSPSDHPSSVPHLRCHAPCLLRIEADMVVVSLAA